MPASWATVQIKHSPLVHTAGHNRGRVLGEAGTWTPHKTLGHILKPFGSHAHTSNKAFIWSADISLGRCMTFAVVWPKKMLSDPSSHSSSLPTYLPTPSSQAFTHKKASPLLSCHLAGRRGRTQTQQRGIFFHVTPPKYFHQPSPSRKQVPSYPFLSPFKEEGPQHYIGLFRTATRTALNP